MASPFYHPPPGHASEVPHEWPMPSRGEGVASKQ
jgi:hypothetical protein